MTRSPDAPPPERAGIPPALSAWQLERLHAGAPPPADLSAADRARLAALAAEDQALLSRLPPARVAAEVQRRLALPDRAATATPTRRGLWLGALAGAAAALALWFARGPVEPPEATPGVVADGVRAKGGAEAPAVLVYRQRGVAEPELLGDGAPARAGDALQLGWTLPAAGYGVLVSVDGAGAVTVHHAAGAQAATLPAGRHVLDHAFVLDAAPAFERFVLVTAAQPFGVAEVLAAARAQGAAEGPLTLPAGLTQISVRLRKEPR